MFRTNLKGDTVSLCRPKIALALMFLICCFLQPVWGYSGGLGSLQAPCVISNVADLIELGQNPNDYSKHFILENDIDLFGYTFEQAVIAAFSEPPLMRVHDEDNAFSGSINGNGHVIRNLTVSGAHNLGLFGALGPSAQIYGLGVVDANIIGGGNNMGILAGYSEGQIYSTYCTGVVSGKQYVGGLVGTNFGLVVNSYCSGQVSGAGWLGGLQGQGGDVVNSYSTCLVQAVGEDPFPLMGGLIGGRDRYVLDSFWDVQTSGILHGRPGTGLNTAEMQDINTYLDAGWDFQEEAANGCKDIWSMPEGGGYPILSLFHGLEPNRPMGCGVTLGRCTLPFDSNQVMWDSSAVFVPSWESVTLTEITKDPNVYPEADPNTQDILITVSGNIDIQDGNNLFALDTQNNMICQAIGDTGNPVALKSPVSPIKPIHTWPLSSTQTRPFELQLQLASDEPVPASLSQLDFFVYALYGQPLVIFDIPLAATTGWLEPTPGFRILVETADHQDGVCNYRIQEEISASRVHFSMTLFEELVPMIIVGHPFPYWDYMYTINLISPQGNPKWNGGVTMQRSYSTKDNKTRNQTRSATWINCTGEEMIRYTIAVKPQKVIVPLTLADVTVFDF